MCACVCVCACTCVCVCIQFNDIEKKDNDYEQTDNSGLEDQTVGIPLFICNSSQASGDNVQVLTTVEQ